MRFCRSILPLPVALLVLSPAMAQKEAGALPEAPTAVEVAELSPELRLQQQVALKAVWLERLIRAREERNRVTRENLSRCALLAQKEGAPASFVKMLRTQASGALSYRERHQLDMAQQDLLAAYGVDAREMRFFVEGAELSNEQLRDVAAWLPLASLFNLPATAEEAASADLGQSYASLLAGLRELAAVWEGVTDTASADAAADALLPVLERHLTALRPLLVVSDAQRDAAIAPYAAEAAMVNEVCNRARARMLEHAWFGSLRLQVLDYLFH